MLVKDIFFSYFCVFFATVTAQLGNKCTVKTSNSAGICKLGSDCPIVEEEASQGIDPTLCGFHELIRPIVCCPTDDFRPQKEDDKNVLVQSLLIPDKDHQRLSEKSKFSRLRCCPWQHLEFIVKRFLLLANFNNYNDT